ncbi:MAG: hypothetical protein ACFFB5_07040 [Promethearchaeota archaeon]
MVVRNKHPSEYYKFIMVCVILVGVASFVFGVFDLIIQEKIIDMSNLGTVLTFTVLVGGIITALAFFIRFGTNWLRMNSSLTIWDSTHHSPKHEERVIERQHNETFDKREVIEQAEVVTRLNKLI